VIKGPIDAKTLKIFVYLGECTRRDYQAKGLITRCEALKSFGASLKRVSALVYVVDRGHVQYAGRLSLADQLRHVLQGHGQSGINRDYVLATVKAIEAEGFRDQPLHRLAMMLHDQHRAALPEENSDR
jgi:cation transport regulator ChaC